MASWIFQAPGAPDRFLGLVRAGLQARGFSVGAGGAFDLAARRGPTRIFVRVEADPKGLLVTTRVRPLGPESPTEGEAIVYEVARDAQLALLAEARR